MAKQDRDGVWIQQQQLHPLELGGQWLWRIHRTPSRPGQTSDHAAFAVMQAILLQIPGFFASRPPSHGPVIPGPLPQQAQGFLLQSLLLRHRQSEDPFVLARVERVLSQVEVAEQPALQRAQPLQQQGQ